MISFSNKHSDCFTIILPFVRHAHPHHLFLYLSSCEFLASELSYFQQIMKEFPFKSVFNFKPSFLFQLFCRILCQGEIQSFYLELFRLLLNLFHLNCCTNFLYTQVSLPYQGTRTHLSITVMISASISKYHSFYETMCRETHYEFCKVF